MKIKPKAFCGLSDEKGIWICDENTLTLYRADKDFKINNAFLLQNHTENDLGIMGIFLWKSRINLLSRANYKIWIFTEDGIEKSLCFCPGNNELVSSMEQYKNEVWMFPSCCEHPVLILNLETLETRTLELKCMIKNAYLTDTFFSNGHIYFMTRKENDIQLGEVDCRQEYVKYRKIHDAKRSNCVYVDNENVYTLYLDKYGSSILEAFSLEGEFQWQKRLNKEINIRDDDSIEFLFMNIKNNVLTLYQYNEFNIILIDLNKSEEIISKISCSKKCGIRKKLEIDNKTILILREEGFAMYDEKKNELRKIEFSIENTIYDKVVEAYINKHAVIVENEEVNLRSLLSIM